MKKTVILIMLITLTLAVGVRPETAEVDITRTLSSMPLAFTENQGQWDDKVLFRAEAGGATMWFTSTGSCLQFTRRIPADNASPGAPPLAVGSEHFSGKPDACETMMIKASFVGANPHPTVAGDDILEYRCNYFLGNDPARWRTDVPNYGAIVYKDIYPGIDLRYYGNGTQMEYDIIVAPGADPSRIKIRYDGIESLAVNDAGELIVRTMWGEATESRPVVYQVDASARVPLDGRYELLPDNSFGFSLSGDYDPSLPLVIDPVLSFSTYLGGSELDMAYDIALVPGGRTIVTGFTGSADFPAVNPYQTFAGTYDVFVTKIDFDGVGLMYSTFIGGTDEDCGLGLAVDWYGAALITGYTYSEDFPTANPYQAHNPGPPAAFACKLDPAGNALIFSTYLGGSGMDIGEAIAIGEFGGNYIVGSTNSADFPLQLPHQTHQGGTDAFLTVLSYDGSALIRSTYLGGSDDDYGRGLAVQDSALTYMTGFTASSDFPTINAFQTDQGGLDAFVIKFSAQGNFIFYSTYLGGSLDDYGFDITADFLGAAYVTGYTASPDFPTSNPYQTDQGGDDVFITKVSDMGTSLIFSTYLGGSGTDRALGIGMGRGGTVYITGFTNSLDYPLVSPAQPTFGGGYDAIVSRIGEYGNILHSSTYLGGSATECGYGIAVLGWGLMEVAGYTTSDDFPLVAPLQTDQGGTDAFVAYIDPGCCVLRGDVNHDGGVNPVDVAFFVDYLWRGGPAPP